MHIALPKKRNRWTPDKSGPGWSNPTISQKIPNPFLSCYPTDLEIALLNVF